MTKKTWGDEYSKKITNEFHSALERSLEKASDKEFVDSLMGTVANGESGGRFPGVNDDGMAISPRQSTDMNPHGGLNSVLTHGPKSWDKTPSSDEEKALFYGFHVHSATNPFGLHTHTINGKLSGAHTHSPLNPQGTHTHKELSPDHGPVHLDGAHNHKEQKPDGGHGHSVENFG